MFGYPLEQRGASNEYPQHMLSFRHQKNIYLIPNFGWAMPVEFSLKERTLTFELSPKGRIWQHMNYLHSVASDLGVIKLFHAQLWTFFLLINMKMPTMLAFSYLLAEKCSCSAMFSKKKLAIVSNLRFISMKNFRLSWAWKKFYNLRAGLRMHYLLRAACPNRLNMLTLKFPTKNSWGNYPTGRKIMFCRGR